MSLYEDSIAYIKQNKALVIERFANPEVFLPCSNPETFLMAGSPGAGKTEWSKNFLETYESNYSLTRFVRIDPDEIRDVIPGYTGDNSDAVQGAASLAAQKIFDSALAKRQNLLFDGTLSRYDLAKQNIERSIKRNRKPVVIVYVHQDPLLAWDITKARELKEGRNVPKETFIGAYFTSKDNVNRLKQEFGKDVLLYLVNKNADRQTYDYKINIENVDNYIKMSYSKALLEEKLK